MCGTALLAVLLCQDRLEELVALLESADPQVRAMAREGLMEHPDRAEPLLEAALRRKGVYAAYTLLTEIRRATPYVSDEQMREAVKPDGSYPRTKLDEALKLAEAGRLHEAVRIVDALLVLEPGGALAGDLRTFRQGCTQRILQAEFVRLDAEADLPRAAVGDVSRVRFKMTNVSHGELRISFGAGKGMFVADVRVRMCEPLGGERVYARAVTAELPREIVIAPGESYTVPIDVETGGDLPEADVFRLYEVRGWFQPMAIAAGSMSSAARVIFKPVDVRVVPRADAGLLTDPLFSLRRAVDEGSVQQVFLSGMLLDGKERDEAVGILIDLLPSLNVTGRGITCYLLGFMTGEKFGSNVKGWQAWRDSKR